MDLVDPGSSPSPRLGGAWSRWSSRSCSPCSCAGCAPLSGVLGEARDRRTSWRTRRARAGVSGCSRTPRRTSSTRLERRAPAQAEQRLDGAIAYRGLVRYDAYNEMSGHQSTSIALLDATRIGRRAVLDPPPRPGAALRQAGARRRGRARALARGGRGRAPGARRRRAGRLSARPTVRVGYLGPAGTFTPGGAARAAPAGGSSSSRCRRSTTRSWPCSDGDGRARARADRELARGLGQRHARRAGDARPRTWRSSARSCTRSATA